MTVKELAPRLAPKFGEEYRPANEFEQKVLGVLDEVLRQVGELGRNVEQLSARVAEMGRRVDEMAKQVDANTTNVHLARDRMLELTTRFDETDRTMHVLAEAASLSAAEARDSAVNSERSAGMLDEERRAAHRLGLEGKPLEELVPPPDRPTDPNLRRSTEPSPPPEHEP